VEVDVTDPWVDPQAARDEYGLEMTEKPAHGAYDGMVVAVPHDEFRSMGADAIRGFGRPEAVLYDLKSIFPAAASDSRL
jgi:UDP-N-acetyl-D-galactosamine dehydrogenase